MNNLTHQGQLISAPHARFKRALSLAFSLCVVSVLSCATLSAEPAEPAEATKPAEATTPAASPQPSPSTGAQAETKAEPAEAQPNAQPNAEASVTPSLSSAGAKAAREAEKEQRLEDLRYKHLWIAYSLIWLVIFSFIRSTWKRSEAVSARLDELKGRLKALEERS